MKNIIQILTFLCCSVYAMAQTPSSFNYQAVARDAAGTILSNQEINVKFDILKDGPHGVSTYREYHEVTTTAYGLFTLEVGKGSPLGKSNLDDVSWGEGEYWLQVGIDTQGGQSFETIGSSQLLSVPYAMHAQTVAEDKDTQYTAGKGLKLVGNEFSLDNINTQIAQKANGASPFSTSSLLTSNTLGDTANDDFVFGSSSINNVTGTNDDKRIIFLKHEGAFRAGSATGTQWNTTNIGNFSAAFGFNTTASGTNSTALGTASTASGHTSVASGLETVASGTRSLASGLRTIASGSQSSAFGSGSAASGINAFATGSNTAVSGNNSFAMGDRTDASGDRSVATGLETLASGDNSFATGDSNIASKQNSFVAGFRNISDGPYSTAIGSDNTSNGLSSFVGGEKSVASGRSSFAFGNNVESAGNNSIAMGNLDTKALGSRSVAIGAGIVSEALGQITLGQYNVLTGADPRSATSTSQLFVVGSGSSVNRRNALTILRSGDATFSESVTIDGSLSVKSLALGTNTIASGNDSFATGHTTTASGTRSLAAGLRSISSGLQSASFGNSTTASGTNSFAIGDETVASGDTSVALGTETNSSGWNSIAMGLRTSVTGNASFVGGQDTEAIGGNSLAYGTVCKASNNSTIALGSNATATGSGAIAIGSFVTSESPDQVTLGRYNTLTGASPSSANSTTRLFVVGNGGPGNRKDAFVLLRNGDATFSESVTIDGSLNVKSLALGTGTTASGRDSFATGNITTASGTNSIATGVRTLASGINSFTGGLDSEASGVRSFAYGREAIASGVTSVAFGTDTNSSGWNSIAMGLRTSVTGDASFAGGQDVVASGAVSFAYGSGVQTTGTNSVAMGVNSIARGSLGSVALGFGVVSESPNQITVGQFNTLTGASSNSSSSTTRLFVVGNGLGPEIRSDALVILRNGNATLAGTLTQNSDRRLKTNITPLKNTLDKIEGINGVNYIWKDTEKRGDDIQLGVIAQEVQAEYPELVAENEQGTLSVNYTGLVPVLLEAVKELKTKLEVSEKNNNGLRDELSLLTAKVDIIMSELDIDTAKN